MTGFCIKCGKGFEFGDEPSPPAYCDDCHKKVMAEIAAKEDLPTGGTSSPPEYELGKGSVSSTRTGEIIQVYRSAGGGERVIRKNPPVNPT